MHLGPHTAVTENLEESMRERFETLEEQLDAVRSTHALDDIHRKMADVHSTVAEYGVSLDTMKQQAAKASLRQACLHMLSSNNRTLSRTCF